MGVFNELTRSNHFQSERLGMDCQCWKSAVPIIIQIVGGVRGVEGSL